MNPNPMRASANWLSRGFMEPRLLTRFFRDRRGIAAVEFGLIAPVLLILMMGAVEVTRAVAIDRRVSVATSMVADLVARGNPENGSGYTPPFSANDINAIYGIVERVMAPYDASALKLSLVPLVIKSDGTQAKVYAGTTNRPSYHGASQLPYCQSYTLPNSLMTGGEFVVVVEATYAFSPMLVDYVVGSTTWTDKAYAKPRSGCVSFNTSGNDVGKCTHSCFN